jgi:Ca-activated chloride channel family protein
MNRTHGRLIAPHVIAALFAAALFGPAVRGQVSVASGQPHAPHIVVPQCRAFSLDHVPTVQIRSVTAEVSIVEQAATTTVTLDLYNPTGSRLESEILMPVPDCAVVRGFTFQGASAEPTAVLLPRDEARRVYNEIVRKLRDPALLEFAGYNLVRSSVFPVEPHGTQSVRLVYEHLLPADGDRLEYVLPRSESLAYQAPWDVRVRVRSKRPISTVYSPSHSVVTKRGPHDVSVAVAPQARTQPGPFRLSWLLQAGDVTASLVAYPDPKVGGGYFLLLAGLPAELKREAGERVPREVTLVIDRSGSMRGEKLQQAREAALQIIAGLEEGEAFNVILYNEIVESFAEQPVEKTAQRERAAAEYLGGMTARGGTNIHDALNEALRQPVAQGRLPIVLFLTDGLPTVGQTSEAAIRDLVLKGNRHRRRVFTFGVGVDVNTPLLEKIASETRATSTFVLPDEDVEVKVGRVFRRLSGPVLADTELRVVDGGGSVSPGRVRDVLPAPLPDLFESDQLVVLGQYIGEEPLEFEVSGSYLGKPRRFRFGFDLSAATTRNAYVPRLWAGRRIAVLVDAIRQLGADGPAAPGTPPPISPGDPRFGELVNEIVRLSTEFGVLTEYTAFLARDGTDLSRPAELSSRAAENFDAKAIKVRSGWASVNQTLNNAQMKVQGCLNYSNSFLDENLNSVALTGVQQVCDKAFFNRGGQWIDGAAIGKVSVTRPDEVVSFGSTEYWDLVSRLIGENRQGCLALGGDVLLDVDGKTVLVKSPE